MNYLWNVLLAADRLLTAIFGGKNELLSSYVYRLEMQGKPWGEVARPLIDMLFFWQDEHCRKTYESERASEKLAPELR